MTSRGSEQRGFAIEVLFRGFLFEGVYKVFLNRVFIRSCKVFYRVS